MIGTIFAIFALFAILILLPTLPFPEIPSGALTSITTLVAWLYSLNAYVPVDTLFYIGGIVILIEFTMNTVRLIGSIWHSITGRPNPFQTIGKTDTTDVGGQVPRSHTTL